MKKMYLVQKQVLKIVKFEKMFAFKKNNIAKN